jgi:hypothetical protein
MSSWYLYYNNIIEESKMTLEEALLEIARLRSRIEDLEYECGKWEQSYYDVLADNYKYVPMPLPDNYAEM